MRNETYSRSACKFLLMYKIINYQMSKDNSDVITI